MTLKYPTLFKGFAMIAPFFKSYGDIMDKYALPLRFFNLLQFYWSFNTRDTSRPGYNEYVKKYAFHYED
jgi:hypothetical protein